MEASFFISQKGDAGSDRLCDQVLALLPTSTEHAKLDIVAQKIVQIQATKIYAFCSPAAQGLVKSVSEFIAAMLSGRKPSVVGLQQPFLVKVAARLQFFCRHTVGKKDLVGADAVQALYDDMLKIKDDKLNLSILEPLTVFSWLLDKPKQQEIWNKTQLVLKQLGTSTQKPSAAKAKAKSKAASSSSSGSAGDVAATDMQCAMSWFK